MKYWWKFWTKGKSIKNKENIKKRISRMIDYRNCCWGHSIDFGDKNEDGTWDMTGFLSTPPEEGDEFLFQFKKGLGVCVFTEVRRCGDPKDMYFGKAGLVRYAITEDIEKAKSKNTDSLGLL